MLNEGLYNYVNRLKPEPEPEPLADWEKELINSRRFNAAKLNGLVTLLDTLEDSGGVFTGRVEIDGHTYEVTYNENGSEHEVTLS